MSAAKQQTAPEYKLVGSTQLMPPGAVTGLMVVEGHLLAGTVYNGSDGGYWICIPGRTIAESFPSEASAIARIKQEWETRNHYLTAPATPLKKIENAPPAARSRPTTVGGFSVD